MAINYTFPSNIMTEKEKYPYIMFSTRTSEKEGNTPLNIILPAPSNITITQSGNYEDFETTSLENLRTIGGETSKIVSNAADKLGIVKNTELINKGVLGKIGDVAKNVKDTLLNNSNLVQNYTGLATKKAINPNANTLFKGNTFREWPFSFSLTPRNSNDAKSIKEIWRHFQAYTYASTYTSVVNISAILDYPPLWNIYFCTTSEQNETSFIPKAWSCYLTTCTIDINPEVSLFHKDGSPKTVNIRLTFKESKVLTREEINDLYLQNKMESRGR